ncbi:MAG: hypothetical protein GY753_19110 [Gammaproteobacteria bacterium]|nr:hypothetical protein [Gammaproteobacteria bacterium]
MLNTNNLSTELTSLFSVDKWRKLTNQVRDYSPDIVVLVARKMPRLAEVFDSNFGNSVVVITDLAIPFCHQIFKDSRVAVIDDVINVGSTVENARAQAMACGASACRLFAIARKDHSHPIDLSEMSLVDIEPMDESEYKDFVRQIPAALQLVAKPYDMDFPVLRCFLRPPFNTAGDVTAWFKERFGSRLHVLTTEREEKHDLSRLTVDFPILHGINLKARFYFDFKSRECNVVPIVIPAQFSLEQAYDKSTWPGMVWDVLVDLLNGAPGGACLWREEPLARGELFVHSLAFARKVLSESGEVIAMKGVFPFSAKDAELLFGPEMIRRVTAINEDKGLHPCDLNIALLESVDEQCADEPFSGHLTKVDCEKIQREGIDTIERSDIGGAFQSLFEKLSSAVGAVDVNHYSLSWPFCKEEVIDKPYLRLRIGFTFKDLLSFFELRVTRLLDTKISARALVSVLLDHYIDSGALVPAIAKYEGVFYRVYRKGESEFRDEEMNRALYAWSCLEQPMSLTRFAKLQAILSFSSEVTTSLVPTALERGNVGYLPPTVVDQSGAEFGRFLLRSGKLMVATNESQ